MPVGVPASAGRLSTAAIAPPAPDDPCILPPVAGYRGLENRLYRIEIHTGGALGTARFKWSRDNGSIVSAISDLAVAGGQTTLTVDRFGRDQVLRFVVGNWVTVTDDFRELAGEPGEMARILSIDEANNKLVLDRGLPTGTGRPFGASAAELAGRHTRVQRWDESAPANSIDGDGLMLTGPGPVDIEDGVEVSFSVDPAGGLFNDGDYWVFWARTATASVEILTNAPPRGVHHHYLQLAAVTGLGGPSPTPTDCRPPPPSNNECCCTFVVAPGGDIQKAIDSLPPVGGCVCLKTGLHLLRDTLTIARSNIRLVGESPGTIVRLPTAATVLRIGLKGAVQDIAVAGIAFERGQSGNGGAVIEIGDALRVAVEDCAVRSLDPPLLVGVAIQNGQQITITRCLIEMLESGIWVTNKDNAQLTFADNLLSLQSRSAAQPGFGILAQEVQRLLRIERNVIGGAPNGIRVNDTIAGAPSSSTQGAEIVGNWVRGVAGAVGAALAPPVFGIDSAADEARIAGNVIILPGNAAGAQSGLRLTGTALQAIDNAVVLSGDPGALPTAGIQLGYSDSSDTVLTTDVSVTGNAVIHCAVGIIAEAVNGADISGNSLEGAASQGFTAGIAMLGCVGVAVHDNRAVGFLVAVASYMGIANRYAGNIIATGSYGIALAQETTPIVTQNRITDMRLAAIAGLELVARADLTENRIAACGYGSPNAASIAIILALGELRIAGNEIIDTGLSLAGASTAPVFGIAALWALEATIDGNQVTYTDVTKRDVTAEDRALLIGGLIESTVTLGTGQVTLGYPIQVLGNKFVGAGRSALVELFQSQINDNNFRRFERVIFSNNYCAHATDQAIFAPPPLGSATVRLTGRGASVIGNQVKSVRGFPSFDFNNMPGPYMGNVTSGAVTRHADLPAPVSAFNLTL